MNPTEVVVEGTLKPDGTLELNAKPGLPPGRVTVVLRPVPPDPSPAAEGWWPFMQRVRAEREAAGYPFVNEAEMEAYIRWLREGDHIDDLLRDTEPS